jgi:hypothetical protein
MVLLICSASAADEPHLALDTVHSERANGIPLQGVTVKQLYLFPASVYQSQAFITVGQIHLGPYKTEGKQIFFRLGFLMRCLPFYEEEARVST